MFQFDEEWFRGLLAECHFIHPYFTHNVQSLIFIYLAAIRHTPCSSSSSVSWPGSASLEEQTAALVPCTLPTLGHCRCGEAGAGPRPGTGHSVQGLFFQARSASPMGPGEKQSSRSEGNRRRVCSWAPCPSACVPAHLPGGHLRASTSSIQTRVRASQRMASLEPPPARSHILSPPGSTSQQSPAVSRESARPRPPAATEEPSAQEEQGG